MIASTLTHRQIAILTRMGHGRTTRQIAGDLHTSHAVVRADLTRAYRTLDARNAAHAVAELHRSLGDFYGVEAA